MKNYLSFGGGVQHPSYRGKNNSQYKHGYAKRVNRHPLYKKLIDMKKRCYNKNSKSYANYGGRGITICDQWLKDPAAFVLWGEKNGWKLHLHIDRIKDAKGYSPDNCQFVTQQQNNLKKSRIYKNNTSGVKGVGVARSGRFTAQVDRDKKTYWLGTFDTITQAKQILDDWRTQYEGLS